MSDAIDRIYDRLVAEEKLKDGTKYERLAAFVFQVLDRSALVVHDVTLKGPGKEAEHQIDVTASDQTGNDRRVIVEARDRDEPVNLDQVRSFQGVIHQIKPDQAWIVCRTRFTADAEKYARDEGIGLAVLRPAEAGEGEDRVKSIHFRMVMRSTGIPTITSWTIAGDDERERLRERLSGREGETMRVDATSNYVYDADGERESTLQELLKPILESLELELGENTGAHDFGRVVYIDILGERAAVRGFSYKVELSEAINEFTVGNPDAVAELIFRSIEGTVPDAFDRVVYDTELAGLALDEHGRVVSR